MFRHRLGALALAAAFAFPLAASAQTAPAPGVMPPPAAPQSQPQQPSQQPRHHHRNRFMHAMRGLQLSDAQKQQIAGILKNARATRAANQAADPQTRRANAKALRDQIESVLTDAQRTRLHANLAAGRRHMKPAVPGQAPAQ